MDHYLALESEQALPCELCQQTNTLNSGVWCFVWAEKPFNTLGDRYVGLCRECAENGWNKEVTEWALNH